jgi:outer membrane protein TolC
MSEAGPQSAPITDQASRLVLPEAPLPLEAEAAIKTALDNRPELGAIVISRRILQLDLDLAKNPRRPQWNLVLQPGVDPGTNGIGGTYKAGIFFSVPLRWNTADGAADNARLKLAKLAAEEIGLRQQITNEVLDALGAVKLAHARAIEAQKAVEQLRQVENGERIMFELGGSSLFLLNQREQATADAESRAIDAIVAYFQSVTLLEASLTELQRKPL